MNPGVAVGMSANLTVSSLELKTFLCLVTCWTSGGFSAFFICSAFCTASILSAALWCGLRVLQVESRCKETKGEKEKQLGDFLNMHMGLVQLLAAVPLRAETSAAKAQLLTNLPSRVSSVPPHRRDLNQACFDF